MFEKGVVFRSTGLGWSLPCGMKLGSYYNINPKHIEIWIPQIDTDNKWNYGSKGRGKWNDTVGSLLSNGKPKWLEMCPLKFEIQTYNVKDFDEMTVHHNSKNKRKFPKRIKELAMFNLQFVAPNEPMVDGFNMTITFNKNWFAKDLISYILKEITDNQIFGYVFLSNIIKYLRKCEMSQDLNDMEIIQRLKPNRFLICDENADKLPDEYYMDDKHEMPEKYSQIKYTDFRMQFLASSDPLYVINAHNMYHSALWVYIHRAGRRNRVSYAKIRVVLKTDESLKDIIINYLIPYLNLSESFKILSHNKHHNKVSDMLIDNILMTHQFQVKESSGTTFNLTEAGINNPEFVDELTAEEMYLIVTVRQAR